MTNRERIRAMSDEELAELMGGNDGPWCSWPDCKFVICRECCFEWLNEEAKDE